jgi:hypothetical protein
MVIVRELVEKMLLKDLKLEIQGITFQQYVNLRVEFLKSEEKIKHGQRYFLEAQIQVMIIGGFTMQKENLLDQGKEIFQELMQNYLMRIEMHTETLMTLK